MTENISLMQTVKSLISWYDRYSGSCHIHIYTMKLKVLAYYFFFFFFFFWVFKIKQVWHFMRIFWQVTWSVKYHFLHKNKMVLMTTWCFTSLSTLFKTYWNDGWVLMKNCAMKHVTVMSWFPLPQGFELWTSWSKVGSDFSQENNNGNQKIIFCYLQNICFVGTPLNHLSKTSNT